MSEDNLVHAHAEPDLSQSGQQSSVPTDRAAKIYDKTGREIIRGDVVKVFHFTGARRKRYYMYKQALGIKFFGDTPRMLFSHLDLSSGDYTERADGIILDRYEIVQGCNDDYEDRPRRALPQRQGDRPADPPEQRSRETNISLKSNPKGEDHDAG